MRYFNQEHIAIPFRTRLKALVLDLIFIALISVVLMFAIGQGMKLLFFHIPDNWKAEAGNIYAQLYSACYLLTFTTYFLFSYYVGNGVTPGKLIFDLQVQSDDHSVSMLTFRESFIRTVVHLFCVKTGYFLFLIPLLNRKRIGLADWLSQTSVANYGQQQSAPHIEELDNLFKLPHRSSEQLSIFDHVESEDEERAA